MRRVLTGLAGAAILCLSALFTLGTALAAPLGMLAADHWARRRGQVLTRGASWLAAAGASSLAIAGAFAVSAMRESDETLRRFHDTASAREAAPMPPPPAWMTRLFPQATTKPDPVTERIVKSRAFSLYFGLMGAGLAAGMLGAIVGSLGWAGTMLLARALPRQRLGTDGQAA